MNSEINQNKSSYVHSPSFKTKILKFESIIFTSCFSPQGDLICGTCFGDICIWKIDRFLHLQPVGNNELSLFTPQIIFRAHSGPVYCLEFINSNNHLKLASGGVDCIRVWDWNTIILITDESTIFPLFELKTQHHLDSQMFLTCPNETNGLSFDPQTGHLFSAGGDSIAYCWDLVTQQCVYKLQGHNDYLHCIKVNSSKHQVLTGSEDSTCRVWDTRSSECITVLNPWKGTATSPQEAKSSLLSSPFNNNWISCLDIDLSSDWLICGSGNKFLSLWYLPTPNVVAYMPMASPVQSVIFWEDSIVSVGNEEYIYFWKTTGALRMRVATHSKSLFTLSSWNSMKHRMLIAAGVPPLVNVYLPPFSYCSCVLSL